jgi:hypothetical protein
VWRVTAQAPTPNSTPSPTSLLSTPVHSCPHPPRPATQPAAATAAELVPARRREVPLVQPVQPAAPAAPQLPPPPRATAAVPVPVPEHGGGGGSSSGVCIHGHRRDAGSLPAAGAEARAARPASRSFEPCVPPARHTEAAAAVARRAEGSAPLPWRTPRSPVAWECNQVELPPVLVWHYSLRRGNPR